MRKILVIILLAVGPAWAEDKSKLKDSDRLAIREAQIQIVALQLRLAQVSDPIQFQLSLAYQKLEDVKKAALANAKADPEKFTIVDDSLELVEKPAPKKP